MLKQMRVFSGVCSGGTSSVTPKFYFISRCLIHRTTTYLKMKKNAKCALPTPTSLITYEIFIILKISKSLDDNRRH